jgi:hypothetical protein
MSEQVHPYCRCLYYAANALARNISRLGEDAFARGISPLTWFPAHDGESKPWRAAPRGG